MKKQFVIVHNAKVQSTIFPMYLQDAMNMEFAHRPTLALQFDTKEEATEMLDHCVENGFVTRSNANKLDIETVEV